jgi:hypothetical protein
VLVDIHRPEGVAWRLGDIFLERAHLQTKTFGTFCKDFFRLNGRLVSLRIFFEHPKKCWKQACRFF